MLETRNAQGNSVTTSEGRASEEELLNSIIKILPGKLFEDCRNDDLKDALLRNKFNREINKTAVLYKLRGRFSDILRETSPDLSDEVYQNAAVAAAMSAFENLKMQGIYAAPTLKMGDRLLPKSVEEFVSKLEPDKLDTLISFGTSLREREVYQCSGMGVEVQLSPFGQLKLKAPISPINVVEAIVEVVQRNKSCSDSKLIELIGIRLSAPDRRSMPDYHDEARNLIARGEAEAVEGVPDKILEDILHFKETGERTPALINFWNTNEHARNTVARIVESGQGEIVLLGGW